MSPLAHLTAEQWPAVSALLDEALALPVTERDTFVQQLDGERAQYRDTLRALLAQAGGVETDQFLATLPRVTSVLDRSAGALIAGSFTELAADQTIGPYRLIRELGAGGMGAVWLAERADGSLKRQVALKLPRLAWGRGLAERMARERDILASLEHPHIARLYDAGVDQHGRPYLALEYVEGQPIDVYARERGLSVRQKLDLLLQVCSAVAFAHSRLVVHRDLKPSNILVTADGQVRLLDFGIAKLMEGDRTQETQLTQMAGRALTLDYASPEQIKGEPIGTASDVYSLGVVAYELLTGSKPYKLKRGSAAELEEAIATADAPQASDAAAEPQTKKALRGDLDAILNKALKKGTRERYATVDALASDLASHADGRSVAARPDPSWDRLTKLVRRWRVPLGVGGAGVFTLSLAVGVGATALLATVLGLGLAAVLVLLQRARAEARRANIVQSFLLDIFQRSSTDHPDPLRAQTATARDLLSMAVRSMRDAPPADPRVAYELTWALLRVLSQLHMSDQAIALARDAVRLSAQAFGRRSFECGMAMLWLAQDLFAVRREFGLQRELLQDAKAIFESMRDRPRREQHLARWHVAWSDLCLHEDRLDEAITAARTALGYAEAHGVPEDIRQAVARLGKLHFAAGHWVQARLFTERSLDVRLGGVDLANRLRRLATLAELQMLDLDLDAARETLSGALRFAVAHSGPWSMDAVQIRLRMARLSVIAGCPDDAVAALQELLSAPLAAEATQPHVTAQARTQLAEALEAAGRLPEAGAVARDVLASNGVAWRPQVSLLLLQARLALAAADPERARETYHAAECVLQKYAPAPNDPLVEQALRLKAAMLGAQGQVAEAAALLAKQPAQEENRPCMLDLAMRVAQRARCLVHAGQFKDAVALIETLPPAALRVSQVASALALSQAHQP